MMMNGALNIIYKTNIFHSHSEHKPTLEFTNARFQLVSFFPGSRHETSPFRAAPGTFGKHYIISSQSKIFAGFYI